MYIHTYTHIPTHVIVYAYTCVCCTSSGGNAALGASTAARLPGPGVPLGRFKTLKTNAK